MSDLPTPKDERVKLREVPDKRVAVIRFSGRYSRDNCGVSGGGDGGLLFESVGMDVCGDEV